MAIPMSARSAATPSSAPTPAVTACGPVGYPGDGFTPCSPPDASHSVQIRWSEVSLLNPTPSTPARAFAAYGSTRNATTASRAHSSSGGGRRQSLLT